LNDWEVQIARARGELLEKFARLGFTVRTFSVIWGEVAVDGHDLPVPMDITLPPGYPYEKPRVRPTDGSGSTSWHRERDGALCLWSDEDAVELPWLDAQQVIERIRDWYHRDSLGWPDDPPDLDLERYWPSMPGLLLHDDLDGFVGHRVHVTRQGYGVLRVHPALRRRGKHMVGLVLDVGELQTPPRTYEDVLLLSGRFRPEIEWDLPHGKLGLLLLRYTRSGQQGLLALAVAKREPVELSALSCAHMGPATMALRSGPDRETMSTLSLAIVGVGAVGSLAADLLARAGVGRLTLVDADLIRPGNCVRHLVGQEYIGRPKVDAVQDWLVRRELMEPGTVTAVVEWVRTPFTAQKLLLDHQLVLDASANAVATAMLLAGGQALQRPVVSVCLQRGGTVARVDRAPRKPEEEWAPAVPPSPDIQTELREGGCGDPVSPGSPQPPSRSSV